MCLPVAVIVELIVGGESDEASPSSRQREEDLSGCVFPHLTKEEVAGKKKKKRREGQTVQNTSWVGLNQRASGTFASFSFSHFGVIK